MRVCAVVFFALICSLQKSNFALMLLVEVAYELDLSGDESIHTGAGSSSNLHPSRPTASHAARRTSSKPMKPRMSSDADDFLGVPNGMQNMDAGGDSSSHPNSRRTSGRMSLGGGGGGIRVKQPLETVAVLLHIGLLGLHYPEPSALDTNSSDADALSQMQQKSNLCFFIRRHATCLLINLIQSTVFQTSEHLHGPTHSHAAHQHHHSSHSHEQHSKPTLMPRGSVMYTQRVLIDDARSNYSRSNFESDSDRSCSSDDVDEFMYERDRSVQAVLALGLNSDHLRDSGSDADIAAGSSSPIIGSDIETQQSSSDEDFHVDDDEMLLSMSSRRLRPGVNQNPNSRRTLNLALAPLQLASPVPHASSTQGVQSLGGNRRASQAQIQARILVKHQLTPRYSKALQLINRLNQYLGWILCHGSSGAQSNHPSKKIPDADCPSDADSLCRPSSADTPHYVPSLHTVDDESLHCVVSGLDFESLLSALVCIIPAPLNSRAFLQAWWVLCVEWSCSLHCVDTHFKNTSLRLMQVMCTKGALPPASIALTTVSSQSTIKPQVTLLELNSVLARLETELGPWTGFGAMWGGSLSCTSSATTAIVSSHGCASPHSSGSHSWSTAMAS